MWLLISDTCGAVEHGFSPRFARYFFFASAGIAASLELSAAALTGASRPVVTENSSPALVGAESDPFGFQINFHIFEVVEDVLTEDSVDFSLCCFRQVRCIHDEDAPVFPDGGADGQRGLAPAAFADESGAFRRRFSAREAMGIQPANLGAQNGGVGAGVHNQDGGLAIDLNGHQERAEARAALEGQNNPAT
jgi:hypothetical protein